MQGAKRAVDAAGPSIRSREGLVVEAERQAVCLRSADMREAIAAFVEQRPPVLPGPMTRTAQLRAGYPGTSSSAISGDDAFGVRAGGPLVGPVQVAGETKNSG